MSDCGFQWNGRAAVVTGGSTGLGLATVAKLAARGANVAAVSRRADRLEAGLQTLEPQIRQRVIAMPADIGESDAVDGLIGCVVDAFGRIDILANVAGVSPRTERPLADAGVEEWHRMLGANLTGMYLMCRAALPHLVGTGSGYIVNVLSTVSHMTAPGATMYAATKTGALGLTQSLIEEYRGTPLRVSSISPGKMNTSVWDDKLAPPSAAERAAMLDPSEVAEIIAWLVERPPHMHVPAIMVRPWLF